MITPPEKHSLRRVGSNLPQLQTFSNHNTLSMTSLHKCNPKSGDGTWVWQTRNDQVPSQVSGAIASSDLKDGSAGQVSFLQSCHCNPHRYLPMLLVCVWLFVLGQTFSSLDPPISVFLVCSKINHLHAWSWGDWVSQSHAYYWSLSRAEENTNWDFNANESSG